MASLRLFAAIAVSPGTALRLREIVALLRSSRADIRWEDPAKYHLTLKFLGDTPEERVDDVLAATQRCATQFSPFSITYQNLGVFPNQYRPRVVWAGIGDGFRELDELHRRFESEAHGVGFPADEKPYTPHLTLGKIKSDKNVIQLLDTLKTLTLDCGPETVEKLEIMRSILHPHGSAYTTLRSFPFTAVDPLRK